MIPLDVNTITTSILIYFMMTLVANMSTTQLCDAASPIYRTIPSNMTIFLMQRHVP